MTRTRIVLVLILVVLVAGGFVAWKMLQGRESTDDARIDGHIYPVSARISGVVASVEVIENQVVDAGAVLVHLDDRPFKIALAKATADLEHAMARQREVQTQLPSSSVDASVRTSSSGAVLLRAQSGVKSAQKDLDVAKARIDTARARLKEAQVNSQRAQRDLDRMKPLIAKDEISQQQYDAFVSAVDAAKASEASAMASVAEAETGVALSEARISEASTAVKIAESGVEAATTGKEEVAASQARISGAGAEIERARAAVDQAKLDLEHTVVVAPVAGTISRKSIEKGSVVQQGQPLLAVVPQNDVWVTASFKETQLDDIRIGQDAEIRVDAYGSRILHARVDSIASATGATFSLLPPENASGNFVKVVQRVPVKLVMTDGFDAEHALRPGMSVVVTVLTQPLKN